MPTVTDALGGRLTDALGAQRRRVREFVDETEPPALAIISAMTLSLLATLVGFLAVSDLTIAPFVVFLTAAGIGWFRYQEETAYTIALMMTVSTILILGLIIVFIFRESVPVIRYESATAFGITVPGLRMFIQPNWDAVSPPIRYSMVPMIHGTVMVTLIASAVAAPLGVSAALFLSEIAPATVREVVKPGVEILAGIPSIVYGFIGFTVLGPWASDQFQTTGQGSYLFVGIVVGLMALPTVVSVAEDALSSVPESMKSGSLAMGTTDWQTMTSITLPAAFSGVSAAVLLGVGRAIGETMAATVMLRGVPRLTEPLVNVFYGQETLTSIIARNYGEADGLQMDALFVAGVILFVTVLVISIGAQYIEWRMHKRLGGEV
ncbi:phosphate ABC transporter permease subunit PstC [Halorubrum ezzemoulense]|uniref:Phosphate transport system permease protein n=1 Tax=Halorubrum ezzemoulense TaxID=337243 RepID=A0A238XEI4_HALEZ|nr:MULTISPECIES: phosphate ABC transporter permease subunit PstC [Halorubrum]MDB2240624.1 phosphate ABC transporter permease subunit PstC [Halorubrum ezzemoulense]MDB2270346.1 phosphate ABC transporter permease subunit PstC [Halorubrum ezzemoulense]MDB9249866.1 phosphate ABC transporter permease subunit PstC [Halorubrum ezzemoulense]MDB9259777.1 phosphate ABC transporter permease subunit PstC [Halorubrum ezzemoulense]MDB9263242.1 phosphate ABC transporter permease subunit PstC [Halorubrum ezze